MLVKEAKWETGIPTRAFELIEVESCSAATWRRSDKSVSMLVSQTTHTRIRTLLSNAVGVTATKMVHLQSGEERHALCRKVT